MPYYITVEKVPDNEQPTKKPEKEDDDEIRKEPANPEPPNPSDEEEKEKEKKQPEPPNPEPPNTEALQVGLSDSQLNSIVDLEHRMSLTQAIP